MAQKIKNVDFLVSRLPLIRRNNVPTDDCVDPDHILDVYPVLQECPDTIDDEYRLLQELAIINNANQLNPSCPQIEFVNIDSDSSESTSESSQSSSSDTTGDVSSSSSSDTTSSSDSGSTLSESSISSESSSTSSDSSNNSGSSSSSGVESQSTLSSSGSSMTSEPSSSSSSDLSSSSSDSSLTTSQSSSSSSSDSSLTSESSDSSESSSSSSDSSPTSSQSSSSSVSDDPSSLSSICDPSDMALRQTITDSGSAFGDSISVNDDGTLMAIGHSLDSSSVGKVEIWTRPISSDTWSFSHTITQSVNTTSSQQFGKVVEMSGDGNWLGVQTKGQNISVGRGEVHMFENVAGTFTFRQALFDSTTGASVNDNFGYSMAMSQDGVHVVIASPRAGGFADAGQGAVYYWDRSGTTWTQRQKFTGDVTGKNYSFGGASNSTDNKSIDLSEDGSILIVGMPSTNSNTSSGETAVYIFSRSGTTWTQDQKIQPAGVTFELGHAVAITPDASRIAFGNQTNDTCMVYSLSGSYSLEQDISLPVGSGFPDPNHVRFNYDGSAVWVTDQSVNSNDGRMWSFTRSGTTWSSALTLTGPTNDLLGVGFDISRSGENMLIGLAGDSVVRYYNCFSDLSSSSS